MIDTLTGGCSCGRNRYVISIPPSATETIQVYFDSGHAQRRHHASPISAWLRIPLIWYNSQIFPVLSDETHSSIKRVYSPAPNEQRHFCGFCGTPLSYWSELPSSESEYISLALGSLSGKDLRNLEEMGALPKEAVEDAEGDRDLMSGLGTDNTETNGVPWFERMVKGSSLGRVRRTGLRTEGNGKTVEWEIVEWTDREESPLKRKIGELERDVGTKIGE